MLSFVRFFYTIWLKFLSFVRPDYRFKQMLKKYIHDNEVYSKVRELLSAQMEMGLSKSLNASATVKMFITYVRLLPDGTERGDYLALDMGSNSFRVLLITLKGTAYSKKSKNYPISEDLKIGSGVKFFDYIADCIANFVAENSLLGKHLPLGFTFSFPCRQEGLAVGRLVRWTKGYSCKGVEGEDIVMLLQNAIKRRGDIDVECVAILNDTVDRLLSSAFKDHSAEIAIILDAGTNACYVEKLDKVELWEGDTAGPNQVIINTEWGAFGDDGCLDFIRTRVDKEIDLTSLNPGKQIFEKMISGMYMGEIVRLVIVDCVSEGLLFDGELSPYFKRQHRFYTKYVSEIERDEESGEFLYTLQILEELGVVHPTQKDCKNVQEICRVVSERAASLASAGIAALVNRINIPNVTVAIDGSLYQFHPHFHNVLLEKTPSLVKDGLKVHVMLSEDGNGIGAAVIAAIVHRTTRESCGSAF